MKRLEEQKAREEKVRLEKLAEAAEKQRKKDAELEERMRKEKEEAGRPAPTTAPAAAPPSTSGKFVPRFRQTSGTAAPAPAPALVSFPLASLVLFRSARHWLFWTSSVKLYNWAPSVTPFAIENSNPMSLLASPKEKVCLLFATEQQRLAEEGFRVLQPSLSDAVRSTFWIVASLK